MTSVGVLQVSCSWKQQESPSCPTLPALQLMDDARKSATWYQVRQSTVKKKKERSFPTLCLIFNKRGIVLHFNSARGGHEMEILHLEIKWYND